MPEVYQVDPLPEMVDQRLSPGKLPNWAIDPTCGKYCLMALLKHHFEKLTGLRCSDVQLPKSTSFLGDLVGYDPYDDFPLSGNLLNEQYGGHPNTIGGWLTKLKNHGPIIVNGKGVGHATTVRHFILLVGANTFSDELYYMDPLRGLDVFKADFATLNGKIDGCVYAKANIGNGMAEHVSLPTNIPRLVFNQ